jgi:hypothetical protein
VNRIETDFVDELAGIAWRKSRLVGLETALIDFQLSIQEEKVEHFHPSEKDNPSFHLVLAWQALAAKALPRPTDDPTVPPDGLDISSIELVRRYLISLDRQSRNVLLNLRQYRKDFAPPKPVPSAPNTAEPNEPQPIELDPVSQAPTPLPSGNTQGEEKEWGSQSWLPAACRISTGSACRPSQPKHPT